MQRTGKIRVGMFLLLLALTCVFVSGTEAGAKEKPTSGIFYGKTYWNYNQWTKVLTVRGKGEMWHEKGDCYATPDWHIWAEEAEKVVITGEITHINDSAFEYFENLREVEMPDTVEVIECSAFSGCRELTKIRLSKQLRYIDALVFDTCEKLESLELPNTVKHINDGAFAYCHKLKKILLSKKLKRIGEYAFRDTGLEEVVIPGNVERIGEEAFEWNPNLKKVRIESKKIKKIGKRAFDEGFFGMRSPQLEIEVPEEKYEDYVKLLRKSGLPWCVKVNGTVRLEDFPTQLIELFYREVLELEEFGFQRNG